MKTIKKILLFLLIVAIITTFSGCSSKNNTTEIDFNALSNELLENIEFKDELTAVDDAVIQKIYNIEDFVRAQVYISSGATAEEISLFEFDSNEKAEEGLKMAMERIEEQKADFGSYIPEELQKLDKAVVKQSGNYVIVCVSSSSDVAEEIITKYL